MVDYDECTCGYSLSLQAFVVQVHPSVESRLVLPTWSWPNGLRRRWVQKTDISKMLRRLDIDRFRHVVAKAWQLPKVPRNPDYFILFWSGASSGLPEFNYEPGRWNGFFLTKNSNFFIYCHPYPTEFTKSVWQCNHSVEPCWAFPGSGCGGEELATKGSTTTCCWELLGSGGLCPGVTCGADGLVGAWDVRAVNLSITATYCNDKACREQVSNALQRFWICCTCCMFVMPWNVSYCFVIATSH